MKSDYIKSRRSFLKTSSLITAGYFLLPSCTITKKGTVTNEYFVSPELSEEMYAKALAIAKSKVRGGPTDPVYKKPYVDAAFNSNIFYWDTCFIACYAKYHQDELPIINALDNFYQLMEADGFICREYTKEGTPMWPKDHPVSINPPLLAFAELELYAEHQNKQRLIEVYPKLHRHFNYLVTTYRCSDGLFFNDALGSGMDNIERFPRGWKDDGQGIPLHNLHPELFNYDWPSSKWNKQGRMVDISAQMVLFARQLNEIASIIQSTEHSNSYLQFIHDTTEAINKHCWNEADAFYYDLGYGKQIPRKHIGMFWTLMAGVVPEKKLERFLAHLTNPDEFWRTIPIATLSADDPDYSGDGHYWRGSVWLPTNYMILRGLKQYNKTELANKLAKQYYWAVSKVYEATGTFWENYAPDHLTKGSDSRPDFCGWTAVVPITIYREFIK